MTIPCLRFQAVSSLGKGLKLVATCYDFMHEKLYLHRQIEVVITLTVRER